MDSMTGLKRTCYCGEVLTAGQEVTVGGFVQKVRDLGNLIFIDLRDRTGVVQLAFNDKTDKGVFEKAAACKSEFVVMAKGMVCRRQAVNPGLKTGEVEIEVSDLRVLSRAQTPPFEVSAAGDVNEELRLKYRYLDLRRSLLQQNIMMRHKIAKVARDYYFENGFIEIETPMMIKSTPEGARDYVVPSRIHRGKFYALPQSPQIYKQLLMVAGFDRYIQLARCFRDEDLRADRQPEFTQIDLEMSFVDVDDILSMNEGFVKRLFKEVLDVDIPLPLPRITYKEAMQRYGSDKPDTRFGMEIQDISELGKSCGFPVFADCVKAGGSVRAIVAKSSCDRLTRKELDKLAEAARGIGAKGLAYIRITEEGASSPFSKFLKDGELDAFINGLSLEKGDTALIVADKDAVALPVLGALRLKVARMLDIVPAGYNFVWITDFPFFEWDEESGSWAAMHHPFTMPREECLPYLESDPGRVVAKAYDLVLNGTELSSGSIRITDSALQERMFKALNLTESEIEAKFGFLVEAYKYGAPPHGGAGIGLDRLAMIICGAESLRDVTAFPKVQNASEPMSGAPDVIDAAQLKDLCILLNFNDKC